MAGKGSAHGVTVKVDGARELRATLKRAGADLSDFNDAHAEAASIVMAEAPAWIHSRSGDLAGSLRVGHARTSATVKAGGAKVPYAGVIEYGWPGHNIGPRPFIRPAATLTEPRWLPLYLDRLDQIVAKVKGA